MRRPPQALSQTRRGLLAAGAAAVLSLGACTDDRPSPKEESDSDPDAFDPGSRIAELTNGLSRDNPYRDPDAKERATARRAARALASGQGQAIDIDRYFESLGMAASHGADPATGRPSTMYVATGSDARSWGALLMNHVAVPKLVVEVPHPGFDINTEKIGLALHRQLPASVLLVAGAHRYAADGAADVAHNDSSLFHVLAVEFADNGLDQVQLHGFADRNLPDADAIVSSGSAPVRPLTRQIASGLSGAGFETCQAWARRCGNLEGKSNEQSRATASSGAAFVHLELSWSIRRSADGRERVVKALAEQLGAS